MAIIGLSLQNGILYMQMDKEETQQIKAMHQSIVPRPGHLLDKMKLNNTTIINFLEANLYSGRWKDYADLFADVEKWTIQKLWLFSNERNTILKQISHIKFNNLVFLSISNNCLQSVELLASAHMPHLQSLLLDKNNICYIKCLRKLSSPLKMLTLNDNSIMDLQFISQLYLTTAMDLNIQQFCGVPGQYCDLRCITKCQTSKFIIRLPLHLKVLNQNTFKIIKGNLMKK